VLRFFEDFTKKIQWKYNSFGGIHKDKYKGNATGVDGFTKQNTKELLKCFDGITKHFLQSRILQRKC